MGSIQLGKSLSLGSCLPTTTTTQNPKKNRAEKDYLLTSFPNSPTVRNLIVLGFVHHSEPAWYIFLSFNEYSPILS